MTAQITRPESGKAGRMPPSLRKIIAVVMRGALMMQLDMTMTNIGTLIGETGACAGWEAIA